MATYARDRGICYCIICNIIIFIGSLVITDYLYLKQLTCIREVNYYYTSIMNLPVAPHLEASLMKIAHNT